MRCRNCEKPIQVLDLCEICEMGPASILPEEMRLCDRGHPMTRLHSEWSCVISDVCDRTSTGPNAGWY